MYTYIYIYIYYIHIYDSLSNAALAMRMPSAKDLGDVLTVPKSCAGQFVPATAKAFESKSSSWALTKVYVVA